MSCRTARQCEELDRWLGRRDDRESVMASTEGQRRTLWRLVQGRLWCVQWEVCALQTTPDTLQRHIVRSQSVSQSIKTWLHPAADAYTHHDPFSITTQPKCSYLFCHYTLSFYHLSLWCDLLILFEKKVCCLVSHWCRKRDNAVLCLNVDVVK